MITEAGKTRAVLMATQYFNRENSFFFFLGGRTDQDKAQSPKYSRLGKTRFLSSGVKCENLRNCSSLTSLKNNGKNVRKIWLWGDIERGTGKRGRGGKRSIRNWLDPV